MSSRSIIVRISLATVFIVVFASPLLAAKGKQSGFQDACADFARLLRRPDCPRDQWLQMIRKFAVLHKKAADPTVRMRSLLLAGKAALDLYKRGARVEDLELSIRTLQQFCRTCRHSSEIQHGMRLLAEAQAIQDALKKRPSENFIASAQPPLSQTALHRFEHESATLSGPSQAPKVEPHFPHSQVPITEEFGRRPAPDLRANEHPPATQPQRPWTNTAARAPIPPAAPPQTQAPNAKSPVLPESPTGNPYCPSGERRLFRLPLPERHAAVPRRAVIDAPGTAAPQPPPPRQFVVVIDPGHGGKDPGAVSADGQLKEKDVTLKVGLEFKRILERTNPQVKALLTRERDEFVSLEDRKAFAHAVDADLFISIHCNSSNESLAKGIETYYFSAASSRRAMDLAARENRASVGKKVDARILRLADNSSIAAASSLAEMVHRGVIEKLGGTVSAGRDRGVKSGPFHILHAAKMPAILVECSFISNPSERAKLRNPMHLHRLAEGIAAGATKYLRDLDKKG